MRSGPCEKKDSMRRRTGRINKFATSSAGLSNLCSDERKVWTRPQADWMSEDLGCCRKR